MKTFQVILVIFSERVISASEVKNCAEFRGEETQKEYNERFVL